jgi:hypothetical protein
MVRTGGGEEGGLLDPPQIKGLYPADRLKVKLRREIYMPSAVRCWLCSRASEASPKSSSTIAPWSLSIQMVKGRPLPPRSWASVPSSQQTTNLFNLQDNMPSRKPNLIPLARPKWFHPLQCLGWLHCEAPARWRRRRTLSCFPVYI